jgi:metal-responsive CopG/Arc/MetJ family transcriptional regulator
MFGMEQTEMLRARCDETLMEALDEWRELHGATRSEVIRESVRWLLSRPRVTADQLLEMAALETIA